MAKPAWLLAGVVALDTVRLTGLDHQPLDVNPGNYVLSRRPPEVRQGHFPVTTRCVVYTSDGKFVPVLEDCDTVRKLMNAAQ